MLERVEAYLNEAQKIIPDWEKYVTDPTIPLDVRWKTYWAAPKEWRGNDDSSMIIVDCLEDIFDSPYDDFGMDRGSTKSMDRVMGMIENKLKYGVAGLTQELINQAKEEIMANGLGEWTYDW